MGDRTFISGCAQSDARIWPIAVSIARALVASADATDGDGIGHLDIHVSEWPDGKEIDPESAEDIQTIGAERLLKSWREKGPT